MSQEDGHYASWGHCDHCGYQGTFAFDRVPGEDYEAVDMLVVMLDASCPACGTREPVLVTMEEFSEMATRKREAQA